MRQPDPQTTIVKFSTSDKRIENLMQALEDVVYERGKDLSFATIIGTIDLLKIQLFESQMETL